jgi:G3E family GTPase
MMTQGRRRPITLVTGFLGSGKTTLLRRFLTCPEAEHTAVLVNEFGEVGLDHHLLQHRQEHTVLLGHGCVCCTLRNDLVQALRELLDQDQRGAIAPLARVVIETTGLADPAPMLFTVQTDPVLQHHFHIAGVVVTVDAVNGQRHLDRHPEAAKQVAVADEIIVTKTDLASPEEVGTLRARLGRLNPTARLTTAVLGDVAAERLLQPGHAGVLGPYLAHPIPPVILETAGRHAEATASLSLSFAQPLDWIAFSIWLSMLLYAHGEHVLRVKGLLDVGAAGPVVLHGVQHIMHSPEHLADWPEEDRRSHLVFILRGCTPEAVVQSLQAFQHFLGSAPTVESQKGLHL